MNDSSSPRNGRRVWVVAGAAVAAGAGWSWWGRRASGDEPKATTAGTATGRGASSPERLGEDFWGLTLPQPDEVPLAMQSLKGRPLLINFWATWCPPCIREMPLLDAFYGQMKSNGLNMLGIAVDSPSPVRQFLGKAPVAFPIVLAGADGSSLARTLGNVQGGLPYTVLADAQGAIIERQVGELNRDHLQRWAKRLETLR